MWSRQPNLYVVAGPNGAGKSTFARLFLPEYADCREFVNADLIAAGLSPFNPESLAIQAGKLMLERIEALAEARIDFGFETTLAGKSWLPVLQRLREQGYRLHIFFLWIPGPDLALRRIEERVRAGGHFIPEEVVRRRYTRGLRNFPQIYAPVVDLSLLLDNSKSLPDAVPAKDPQKSSARQRRLLGRPSRPRSPSIGATAARSTSGATGRLWRSIRTDRRFQ
ncbi:MAG TPA: zeta toxin family protein [Thermoanaerobaculia bacterium]|nr:zeta toxin family protein [Thermoanaerobaculia bacterium]